MPEIFGYWLQAGRVDVGFLGAAQLDRFANLNTTGFKNDQLMFEEHLASSARAAHNRGGNVLEMVQTRQELASSGRTVRIRGYCRSACTILTTMPNACLGPHARIFGRVGFGNLAEFHVLDDRQYRSHQVCPRPGRGG